MSAQMGEMLIAAHKAKDAAMQRLEDAQNEVYEAEREVKRCHEELSKLAIAAVGTDPEACEVYRIWRNEEARR